MSEMAAWLEARGLGKYTKTFAENAIDFDILAQLGESELKELGIPLGDRMRLLHDIAALNAGAVSGADLPFVSPAVPPPQAQAERRQLTVVFVDLVGSTALSGRLDPEDLRELMLGYQNAVAGEITRFQGHVSKYMGDGVLAYFGWPRAHEDEVKQAVSAGLAVIAAVAKLRTPVDEPLAARVGIATGLVIVGDRIGEGAAQEEAVVGQAPNLAARLQALAKPNSVVIADSTRQLLGDEFAYTDLGAQSLKGFAQRLRVWQVTGPRTAESRFALHHRFLTPMIGREAELDLLIGRWRQARAGKGQVVLLSGEPGIGKSRMIQAVCERVGGQPHTRLNYQCSPYHNHSALYPVIQQLERAAGFDAGDDAMQKLAKLEALLAHSGAALTAVVPLFASLLSIPLQARGAARRYAPLQLAPQRQKQLTLEALTEQLAATAVRQPVILVLEDVHWIDPTTQELMGLAIDCIRNAPVLLLITFRPEFTPPWADHAHVTTLRINRLSRRQAAALAGRMTGGKALPDAVLNEILSKSDGVPLFIEELLKNVLESGRLKECRDRFLLDGPLPALAVPGTLQDSLMSRLDRLGPVKEIAQIGAVIGRKFSYQLIAAVTEKADSELQAALAQLIEAGLIFSFDQPPAASYIFKHALVRDAAYQSLLKSKRRELHYRTAMALAQRFAATADDKPELLAYHYTEADRRDEALTYWYKAARLAIRRSAYVEALAHLDAGLRIVETLPAGVLRSRRALQLQTALAEALLATHGYVAAETVTAYERAWQYCRELGDPADIFSVLRGIFSAYMMQGKHHAAHKIAQECLQLAEQQDKDAPISLAHRLMGQSRFLLGELAAARAHFEQALALYDGTAHRSSALAYGIDLKSCPLAFLAPSLCLMGYPRQALLLAEQNLSHSRQLGFALNLAVIMSWGGYTRLLRRDYEAAARQAEELLILAQEHGLSAFIADAEARRILAESQLQPGGTKFFVRARRCIDALRAHWNKFLVPYNLGLLANACVLAGQAGAAYTLIDDALALSGETEERWSEPELRRLQGEILLRQNHRKSASGAEACFRRALSIARYQQAKWWELRTATSLARLWRDQDKQRQAYALLAPVYGGFTEGFDTADLQDAKALLNELAKC